MITRSNVGLFEIVEKFDVFLTCALDVVGAKKLSWELVLIAFIDFYFV